MQFQFIDSCVHIVSIPPSNSVILQIHLYSQPAREYNQPTNMEYNIQCNIRANIHAISIPLLHPRIFTPFFHPSLFRESTSTVSQRGDGINQRIWNVIFNPISTQFQPIDACVHTVSIPPSKSVIPRIDF